MKTQLLVAVLATLITAPTLAQPVLSPGRQPADLARNSAVPIQTRPDAVVVGDFVLSVWVEGVGTSLRVMAARQDRVTGAALEIDAIPVTPAGPRTFHGLVASGDTARLFVDIGQGDLYTVQLDPMLPELVRGCPERVRIDYASDNGFRVAPDGAGFAVVWARSDAPGVVHFAQLDAGGQPTTRADNVSLDEVGVVFGEFISVEGQQLLSWSTYPNDGGETRSGVVRFQAGQHQEPLVLASRPFVRGKGTYSHASLAASGADVLAVVVEPDGPEFQSYRLDTAGDALTAGEAVVLDGDVGVAPPSIAATASGWLFAWRDEDAALHVSHTPATPSTLEPAVAVPTDLGVTYREQLVPGDSAPLLLHAHGGGISTRLVAVEDGAPVLGDDRVFAARPDSRGSLARVGDQVIASWATPRGGFCLGLVGAQPPQCSTARVDAAQPPALLAVGGHLIAAFETPTGVEIVWIQDGNLELWPEREGLTIPDAGALATAQIRTEAGPAGGIAYEHEGGIWVLRFAESAGAPVRVAEVGSQPTLYPAGDGFLVRWVEEDAAKWARFDPDDTVTDLPTVDGVLHPQPTAAAGTPDGLVVATLGEIECGIGEDAVEECVATPGTLVRLDGQGARLDSTPLPALEAASNPRVLWRDFGPVVVVNTAGWLEVWAGAGWERVGALAGSVSQVEQVGADLVIAALTRRDGPRPELSFHWLSDTGPDTDGDGVPDLTDACPDIADGGADGDGDGIGDACDPCPEDVRDRRLGDDSCLSASLCQDPPNPDDPRDEPNPEDEVPEGSGDDEAASATGRGSQGCGCTAVGTRPGPLSAAIMAGLLCAVLLMRRRRCPEPGDA